MRRRRAAEAVCGARVSAGVVGAAAAWCAVAGLGVGVGCVDVVARARADADGALGGGGARPRRGRAEGDGGLPDALRLEPEWQRCERAADCVVVRGVPGQRREALCCGSCEARAVALSAAQASRVEAWRAGLGCEAVVCGPLGDCAEEVGAWEAACAGGVCRLKARETTAPSAP